MEFLFKVEVLCLCWAFFWVFDSRWSYLDWSVSSQVGDLLFVTWNLVKMHKARFEFTYVSIYKWFQELSNDRSYAQFRWNMNKLWLFYEALSNWNFTWSGALSELRPIGPKTSASLNLMTARSSMGILTSGMCDFFRGLSRSIF